MNAFDTYISIGVVLGIWTIWMLIILFFGRIWRNRRNYFFDGADSEYDGLLFRRDGSMRPYGGFGDRDHPDHPSKHGLE